MGYWLAWGVHLYTATGALVGLWALHAIDGRDFRLANLLMLAAMAIDSTDGLWARRVQVKRHIPWIDGRRLDDICDFFTYVLVPAFMLVQAGLLPHPLWAAAPVLASAYGFCQEQAKTSDHYFLGFPSYWNVVASYLYLLGASPPTALALVLVGSIGVFIPIRYIYPTRTAALRRSSMGVMVAWAALFLWLLLQAEPSRGWLWFSLALGPGYYLALSFALHFGTPRAADADDG